MRLLIVNGDDFGLARGVNAGIIEAHTHGILTSTSLMVLAPAARDAAALARANPELSVGLHFQDDGRANLDDPIQAASAVRIQLERFRELIGRDPSHFDSHHHVHAQRERMATFTALVESLGVPVRNNGRVAYIGGFWAQVEPGVTKLERVSRRALCQLVEAEVGNGFTELACHPGRITGDFRSSYLHEREAELQTLTEPGLTEELGATGVKLVSYHDWPSRSQG